MSEYVTKEMLEEARKIDLLTYLQNYEPYELVKVSSGTYTTKKHDSVRISNGLWHRFSANIGGKSAIDYLIKVEGYTLPQAVKRVLNRIDISPPRYIKQESKSKEKRIILPKKASTNDQIVDYLMNRGIDESIINYCIINNLIYQEESTKNVVFLGYDDNKNIKYAGLRSTDNERFMKDAKGSSKEYSFRIEHKIFREPFKKINSERKIEKKLPNYLSLAEAKNLIKIYANSEDPIKIRDNAMLHIFLNCGLRLSEIKNLNLDDINLKDDRFTIIGKGNKERTNYLNDITKEALLKYLEIRDTSHDKARGNPLFLTAYGLRMSDKTIKMIVKRAYKKSGLDEKVYSVHTLRHTCATILYKAGCDIHTIQKLLGHVQIDTTEIYTHLHDQEVMDVMLNHPLAQYKMENALAYCA